MTPLDLVLDTVARGAADLQIADAVTGGTLERTIEGASTLTLELHDPHRKIIRHKALTRAIDFRFDGTWWRLVKVGKVADTVTLTFEDRDVAYLRRHSGPRSVLRKTHTRAQFVRMLVREVGKRRARDSKTVENRRIKFYCPEVNERQPIGKPPEDNTPHRRTRAEREDRKQKGVPRSAELTVKGARRDLEQWRNANRVLDVADQLGAGPKATQALMAAVITESQVRNLSGGDRDSQGILQLRVGFWGADNARSIEKSCRLFLTKGFYNAPPMGAGGAIEKARKFPNATAGEIAQGVQGSGVPDAYDQWTSEAAEWIDAYGGATGTDTGGTTTERQQRKRYQFSRGEPGKPEDSWTCIQRLATDVNWRAFMDRGVLYYISENRLRKAAARYVLTEDTDGVNWIDFDLDHGKIESEMRVSCRTDLFDIRIGSVVVVRELGVGNGRYLVATVRQNLFDHDTEVTLKRPSPKLPEPLAELKTVTKRSRDSDSPELVNVTGLRNRIIAVAQASAAHYRANKQSWFYSQSGALKYYDPTKAPLRGYRSDCSHWVACVYKKAGAPAPGPSYQQSIFTGNMRIKGTSVPLHAAIPGDIIIWPDHVELYTGPGNKTLGHGSAPVDAGTWDMKPNPTCWRYNFLGDDTGDDETPNRPTKERGASF